MKLVLVKKPKKPTWSDVKRTLAGFDRSELLGIIGDLHRLSPANRDFLNARFSIGANPQKPYKKIIKESLYPEVMSKKPIRISPAKQAISAYAKAVGDAKGTAELMVYFVECGNQCTLDYGDIDEPFYDALISMYGRALDKVLELPEEEQEPLRERLQRIMESSSGIGWGYHDALCDLYEDTFSEEE
jgi:hypothetical protein